MRFTVFLILSFLLFSSAGYGNGVPVYNVYHKAGPRNVSQSNTQGKLEPAFNGGNATRQIQSENKLSDPAWLAKTFTVPAPIFHCNIKNHTNGWLLIFNTSIFFASPRSGYFNYILNQPLIQKPFVCPHHHFW